MPPENPKEDPDFYGMLFVRRSGGHNPQNIEKEAQVKEVLLKHALPMFKSIGRHFMLSESEQRRIVGAFSKGFMQRSRLHQFSFQLLGKKRRNPVGRVELRFEAPASSGDKKVKIITLVIGPASEARLLKSTGGNLQKALARKIEAVSPLVGREFSLANVEVRHE